MEKSPYLGDLSLIIPKLHEGDGGNILYRAAALKLFSMRPVPNKRDVDIGIEHDLIANPSDIPAKQATPTTRCTAR